MFLTTTSLPLVAVVTSGQYPHEDDLYNQLPASPWMPYLPNDIILVHNVVVVMYPGGNARMLNIQEYLVANNKVLGNITDTRR